MVIDVVLATFLTASANVLYDSCTVFIAPNRIFPPPVLFRQIFVFAAAVALSRSRRNLATFADVPSYAQGARMAPLLRPEDCCILFIDPVRRNIERIEIEDVDTFISRYVTIQEAAKMLDVPEYFAIDREHADKREWIAQPRECSKPRVYVVGPVGSLCSTGLGAALTEEGRACLVLCGFWLEMSVTFAALNALADGFDVFVLMDACPSCDHHARDPAVNRLLQAGVVPLTTTQMVSEWAEVAPDDLRRSLLRELLASSVTLRR